MKREIKFRAIMAGTNDWIYGLLSRAYKENYYDGIIDDENNFEYIRTDTVGQFTGLKDKNGKEIYEGDILKNFKDLIGVVEFGDGKYFADEITSGDFIPHDILMWEQKDIEIIGNVYENPELLNE